MKELTDPASPSYVPIPYPKNRPDIILDLRYYVETMDNGGEVAYVKGFVPVTDEILKNLFSAEPDYEIGRIQKIKNRIVQFPDHYTWLVFITDREGNIVMRVALLASGLMASGGAVTDEDMQKASLKARQVFQRYWKPKKDEQIKSLLSEALGWAVAAGDIKKMDRIAFSSTLGNLIYPLWEIKMRDGTVYYYSIKRDAVYAVEKKVSWKKDKRGLRKGMRTLVGHLNYLPDTVSDELIVLEEKPRIK